MSMAAACNSLLDIFSWIQNLPPITQWKTNAMAMCIYPSYSSQPSLELSITKNLTNSSVSFSIVANYNLPILLWTSKPLSLKTSMKLLDDANISHLLLNLIEDVLKYCPSRNNSFLKFPKIDPDVSLKDIFNLCFLTLTFIICIYEAPVDLRSACLETLKNRLACFESRQVSKQLMRLVGSNIEEQLMRTMNLAITNWIVELKSANNIVKTPSSLFSYSLSASGLWKVQLYCPVIAMGVENSNHPPPDDRLLFSLNFHQLEGVIQLNHKVAIRDKWIDVMVNTDNIRYPNAFHELLLGPNDSNSSLTYGGAHSMCDVIRLITETLMKERGAGTAEKHFPSRICLQLTPTMQAKVLSISVSKSSENPAREIGHEKGIEGSFDPSSLGINLSASETITMSMKPWKFEQSVYGASAILNWFLHDSGDGKEVFSSKPSKFSLLHPKAWFKNRYANVHRPFTRQGGVIFARDEYGESVCWKVDKYAMGKSMEWEIKGWIWLTYWPNKHRTFYTETRRLEFRELLYLTLS